MLLGVLVVSLSFAGLLGLVLWRGFAGAPVVWRAAMALLPVAALGLYAVLGTPGQGARPFAQAQAERQAADPARLSPQEHILLLEEIVKRHPDDAEGWQHLGRLYLATGRPEEAMQAFRRTITLQPDLGAGYAAYGEARVKAAGGRVDPGAVMAFEEALARDPRSIPARFFMALSYVQTDQMHKAEQAFRALLPDLPLDAPRRPMVEAMVSKLADMNANPDKEKAS